MPPYRARELPPDEWIRLHDLPPFAGGLPNPDGALVIVVEDEPTGQIVASWIAADFVHLEGVWADDTHRAKTRVPALLLAEMRRILRERGVAVVFTIAPDAQVQAVAEHAGFEVIPGTLLGCRLDHED